MSTTDHSEFRKNSRNIFCQQMHRVSSQEKTRYPFIQKKRRKDAKNGTCSPQTRIWNTRIGTK